MRSAFYTGWAGVGGWGGGGMLCVTLPDHSGAAPALVRRRLDASARLELEQFALPLCLGVLPGFHARRYSAVIPTLLVKN